MIAQAHTPAAAPQACTSQAYVVSSSTAPERRVRFSDLEIGVHIKCVEESQFLVQADEVLCVREISNTRLVLDRTIKATTYSGAVGVALLSGAYVVTGPLGHYLHHFKLLN